ncbi:MAG: site-2 protease family protein [Flavobacteriales bacterium]|nr:site-2 protease family protein [Flavobacteriales bacterium]
MAAPTFSGSAGLFSFKGIRVFVHWSFSILIAWVVISGLMEGHGWPVIGKQLLMILIVFGCVVLHEFGHALMALRFGIRTKDITLLPIGGLANLERIPEEPRKEFLITIAGPLVNLAIVLVAGAILGYHWVSNAFSMPDENAPAWATLSGFLVAVNLWMFLFNLIPAFPMDGGRLLRSALASFMDRARATQVAVTVGRVIALIFIAVSFTFRMPMLALVGLFVYLAAGAENRNVRTQHVLRGIHVGQVMRTRFWAMPGTATVQQAVDELLAGGDQDLVVVDGDAVLGVVRRKDLIAAIHFQKGHEPLRNAIVHQPPAVAPTADANEAYMILLTGQWPLLPVVEHGRLMGVLEAENLAEYLMVKEARRSQG